MGVHGKSNVTEGYINHQSVTGTTFVGNDQYQNVTEWPVLNGNVSNNETALTNVTASLGAYLSSVTTQSNIFTSQEELSDYEEYAPFSIVQKIWIGIALGIASLTIIIGNILTIAVFIRDPKIRSVQNMYIVNLAITDLLIGLSSVPFYALYSIFKFNWMLGYTYCKIWSLVDYWVCAESSLTIILISYDRLQMVSQGAQYINTQTKNKALVTIAITWLTAFIIYGPAIIGYNHWKGYSIVEEGDCDVEFAEEFGYIVSTAFLEFCIPFILLVLFSSLLYWNIRKRSLKVMNSKIITVSTITQGNKERENKEKKMLRKDKKAAKSLAILVVTYAVCWTPYTILTIANSLCDGCVSDELYEPATWLLWFNSGLNPFLYAATNRQFRSNFSQLLCKCNKCVIVTDKVYPMKSSTQCDSPVTGYST